MIAPLNSMNIFSNLSPEDTASWDSTLKIWDLVSGQELRILKGHNGQVLGVSVFSDGSKAVSVGSDRTLKIWDLHTGGAIASFTADSTLLTCTVAPDNTTIVVGDILGCVHFLRLGDILGCVHFLRLENMDGGKEE